MNFKKNMKSFICCVLFFLGTPNVIYAMNTPTKANYQIEYNHEDYKVIENNSIQKGKCDECKEELDKIFFKTCEKGGNMSSLNLCKSCMEKRIKKILLHILRSGGGRDDYPKEYIDIDCSSCKKKYTTEIPVKYYDNKYYCKKCWDNFKKNNSIVKEKKTKSKRYIDIDSLLKGLTVSEQHTRTSNNVGHNIEGVNLLSRFNEVSDQRIHIFIINQYRNLH